MTVPGLFTKTLRDMRTATIAVGAVSAAIGFFDVLLFPSYQESLKDFKIPDAFKGFLGEAGSIATPEGFIAAEFFSWIPLLLITIAIIGATGTIAGEEAAGTLDLLLAQPISRTRLLLHKTAGLAISVAIAAFAGYPAILLGRLLVDFDISALRLFEAIANMLPVTLLYLALGILGSAALPTRSSAAATAIGAVVVGYFLNTAGAAVDLLAGPRKLSPFYWADAAHVLVQGFDWLRAGSLVGLAALLLAAAVWSFNRRDISAGRREWSIVARLRRPRAAETDETLPSRLAG